jgi:hypothetical protein
MGLTSEAVWCAHRSKPCAYKGELRERNEPRAHFMNINFTEEGADCEEIAVPREATMIGRGTVRQAYSFARSLTFVIALLVAAGANGADCREGTIQGVRLLHSEDDRSANGTATLNGTDTYEIIVRLGTDLYITLYQPKWKWSFKAKELTVGDQVPVRISEKNLFLNCGTSKEIKVRIVESRRAMRRRLSVILKVQQLARGEANSLPSVSSR